LAPRHRSSRQTAQASDIQLCSIGQLDQQFLESRRARHGDPTLRDRRWRNLPGTLAPSGENLAQSTHVSIGGVDAAVQYAGSAPGEVEGLFQINAAVQLASVPVPSRSGACAGGDLVSRLPFKRLPISRRHIILGHRNECGPKPGKSRKVLHLLHRFPLAAIDAADRSTYRIRVRRSQLVRIEPGQ
jgi:hypothetical protein